MMAPSADDAGAVVLTRTQARRLREIYRSAGWPSQDGLEIELLAAGMLERCQEGGHERVRLTDAGIAGLAQALQRNRQALSAHDALVARVARRLLRDGRVVWTGLSVRARLPSVAGGAQPAAGAGAAHAGRRFRPAATDARRRRHALENLQARCVFDSQHLGGGLSAAGGARDQGQPGRPAGRPAPGRQTRQLPRPRWPVLVRAGLRRARAVRLRRQTRCRRPAASSLPAPTARLDVVRHAPRRAVPDLPFALWMALAKATPLPAAWPIRTRTRPAKPICRSVSRRAAPGEQARVRSTRAFDSSVGRPRRTGPQCAARRAFDPPPGARRTAAVRARRECGFAGPSRRRR